LFGISRQAIYQAKKRVEKREFELQQIKELVMEVRLQMPRLGTRKLYYLIKDEIALRGIKLGRDALFNYLRREYLLIRPKKNYTKTTYSKHWLRKHPNLYLGKEVTRPDEVYVSDITYIKSRERTHYLSLVTDAFSRKIVGHHLSDDISAESVVKALKKAVKRRQCNLSMIHHSDRGLQYCSGVYQEELKRAGITPSMTDGYDCYQNALAERINGILKQEFLLYKCKNHQDLKRLIDESINIYNNKRPHLSLGMKTPKFVHEKTLEGMPSRVELNL
jgi:putative transposase